MIEQKILKEKNIDKLNLIEDEIINAKYLMNIYKQDLLNKRDEQIQKLKKDKEFERLKQEILDTNLISSLLNLYKNLIDLSEISVEQKQQLYDIRKNQLIINTNKEYDNLKDVIKNERDIERLEDKSQHDQSINSIREEYLDGERTKKDLHILRRHILNLRQSYEENEQYDTIKSIIETTDNIDEIKEDSVLVKELLNINQILLTDGRNKGILELNRRTRINKLLAFKTETYNDLRENISNENDIIKLDDTNL